MGEDAKIANNAAENEYAIYIEDAGGMDKIVQLQTHDNSELYNKSYAIIDKYFNDNDEDDTTLAPAADQNANQFTFNTSMPAPQGGFNF